MHRALFLSFWSTNLLHINQVISWNHHDSPYCSIFGCEFFVRVLTRSFHMTPSTSPTRTQGVYKSKCHYIGAYSYDTGPFLQGPTMQEAPLIMTHDIHQRVSLFYLSGVKTHLSSLLGVHMTPYPLCLLTQFPFSWQHWECLPSLLESFDSLSLLLQLYD